jgi:hypothetical protein
MKFMGVNLWAVLVSALTTMVVGFVWYSPLLFARPWMVLMGYDPNDKAKIAEMQKSAGPSYVMSLVASILSAAVLGKIIAIATINTPLYGMKVGLAVWLGFVTTVQLTSAGSRPNCMRSTRAISWCASWQWERLWVLGGKDPCQGPHADPGEHKSIEPDLTVAGSGAAEAMPSQSIIIPQSCRR